MLLGGGGAKVESHFHLQYRGEIIPFRFGGMEFATFLEERADRLGYFHPEHSRRNRRFDRTASQPALIIEQSVFGKSNCFKDCLAADAATPGFHELIYGLAVS